MNIILAVFCLTCQLLAGYYLVLAEFRVFNYLGNRK
jgi:hypothetical protein